MNASQQVELEAAAFRRLLAHLDSRKDVQNIELMNTSGFCRNCLSKWMLAEAQARDIDMTDDQAREHIYGMPYSEWKANHQLPATPEQMLKFNEINAAKKS